MKKQLAKLLKSYHKKFDCFGNKKGRSNGKTRRRCNLFNELP
jgi:hypothetical protein